MANSWRWLLRRPCARPAIAPPGLDCAAVARYTNLCSPFERSGQSAIPMSVQEQAMLQYDASNIRSIAAEPAHPRAINKAAIVAAKLIITGLCFWYLSRTIDFDGLFSSLAQLELRWVAAGACIVILEIPFAALRWREILKALVGLDQRITSLAILAITAVGAFFMQVLPTLMGDGVRGYLLVRRGCDLRNAVTSIAIDRGVSVAGILVVTV